MIRKEVLTPQLVVGRGESGAGDSGVEGRDGGRRAA